MIEAAPALLFWLVVGHALADYPLQGDFLARAKNRSASIPGFPWWQALTAHAVIHGGVVAYITGFIWLGVAEIVAHWIIDDLKCRGKIGLNTDQALHIICKALWALVVIGAA